MQFSLIDKFVQSMIQYPVFKMLTNIFHSNWSLD